MHTAQFRKQMSMFVFIVNDIISSVCKNVSIKKKNSFKIILKEEVFLGNINWGVRGKCYTGYNVISHVSLTQGSVRLGQFFLAPSLLKIEKKKSKNVSKTEVFQTHVPPRTFWILSDSTFPISKIPSIFNPQYGNNFVLVLPNSFIFAKLDNQLAALSQHLVSVQN